jgi:hypothetical protein
MCYPILMCTPSPLLPNVKYEEDFKSVFLSFKRETLAIRREYFKKLVIYFILIFIIILPNRELMVNTFNL